METRLSSVTLSEELTPTTITRAWWRSLIRCNPFYLLSSILLVYGIYRVAIDPFFAKRDLLQILFSFGSLELYSAMLVLTSIWLARKSIWYDSTLLVFLQNMLVLMPFMLASHAVFMGNSLAWTICLSATFLAVVQFGSFKMFFPRLNLPGHALFLGLIVLCVNLTLPLLFRRGMDADIELWADRRDYFWFIVLPLLVLFGSILPSTSEEELTPKDEHEQPWIPLVSFLLWVGGTVAHLYIIDYVDEQKFGLGNITVLIWALSWLLVMKARDFVDLPALSAIKRNLLLLVPCAATLPSFVNESIIPVTLNLLNALIFAFLAVRQSAKHCAIIAAVSATLALLAIPEALVIEVIKGYRKELLLPLLTLAAGLWVSLRSRTAKGALLGAFCLALITGWAFHRNPWGAHAMFQISALYFVAHSLFWTGPQERGAWVIRALVAFGWAADCILLRDQPATARAAYLLPVVMLVLAAAGYWMLRVNTLVLAFAAATVFLAVPLYSAAIWVARAPLGILAIFGGFALFALGTLYALRRKSIPDMMS